MKQYVGCIDVRQKDIAVDKIYSEDNVHFYCNDKEMSGDQLSNWAVCLNSPWSQTEESYHISVNCKDSYTEIDEGSLTWKCEYEVIGYECITSTLVGYGMTPEEALQSCIQLFKHLQETYNPENDSF